MKLRWFLMKQHLLQLGKTLEKANDPWQRQVLPSSRVVYFHTQSNESELLRVLV